MQKRGTMWVRRFCLDRYGESIVSEPAQRRLGISLEDPYGNRIRVGSRTGAPRGPGYTFP